LGSLLTLPRDGGKHNQTRLAADFNCKSSVH
jgi:hypothetical protein